MSYDTAKRIPLSNKKPLFSGGYVDNVSNVDMAPYFSPYLRNARIFGNDITIRPGHFLFATLTAGSYPKGIGSYLRADKANNRLIVRHNQNTNKKLVSITSAAAITEIDTSTYITSDNKMRFINTQDNLYCMNGVDPYGKLNGTTYTVLNQAAVDFKGQGSKGDLTVIPQNTTIATYVITVKALGTPDTFDRTVNGGGGATGVNMATTEITLDTGMHIKFGSTTGHIVGDKRTIYARMAPAFGVMFNGSIFVAGSSSVPSVVCKSAGNDIESFNGIGSDTFKFKEKVTGLATTTQGLFYFTNNTISVTGTSDIQDTNGTMSYITRVMNAKEGSVNHDSIVESGVEVYYITPNNNINKLIRGQSVNGYEEVELSQRSNSGISMILSTMDPDQTSSFGYFLPKENIIKRHMKSQGASFNDTVIVYDTIKDAFLVDTNKYFYDAVVFNSKYYALSMIESKIYQDEYSFADENSPIPFTYRSKEFFIGDSTMRKLLRETRTQIEINELAVLTQEIRLDGGLVDTITIDKQYIKDLYATGLGTYEVGTEAIGTEGPFGTTIPEDMHEVDVLRTKGNLNKKFKKMQFRRTNTTTAGKILLKELNCKVEGLPSESTNLTIT